MSGTVVVSPPVTVDHLARARHRVVEGVGQIHAGDGPRPGGQEDGDRVRFVRGDDTLDTLVRVEGLAFVGRLGRAGGDGHLVVEAGRGPGHGHGGRQEPLAGDEERGGEVGLGGPCRQPDVTGVPASALMGHPYSVQ